MLTLVTYKMDNHNSGWCGLLRPMVVAIAGCLLLAFGLSRDFVSIGRQGDSLAYFSSAKSLVASGSLLLPTGEPNTIWPPGYPVALSPHVWFHLPVEVYARLLHVGYYILLVCLAFCWIRTGVDQSKPSQMLVYTAVFATFPPTLYLVCNALSELQYVVFCLMALWFLTNAGLAKVDECGLRKLILASICCAVAVLTRLQGVTLLSAGALMIVCDNTRSMRRRVAWLAVWCLPALILLGLWLARNVVVSGAMRPLGGEAHSLFRNVSSMALSYVSSVVPVFGQSFVNRAPMVLRGIACVLVLLPVVVWAVRSLHTRRKDRTQAWDFQSTCLLYGLVDLAVLPVMASVARVDDLHFRFIQASGAMFLLAALLGTARRPRNRHFMVAGCIVVGVWVAWALYYVHNQSHAWDMPCARDSSSY